MKEQLKEHRTEPRSLCADLVRVEWTDGAGNACACDALLEDISSKGACLQLELRIPENIEISVSHGPDWTMLCQTVYCLYRDIGYFVGIRFDERTRWSETAFRPQHLLNLADLTATGLPAE
jgi:hypothetical protein